MCETNDGVYGLIAGSRALPKRSVASRHPKMTVFRLRSKVTYIGITVNDVFTAACLDAIECMGALNLAMASPHTPKPSPNNEN